MRSSYQHLKSQENKYEFKKKKEHYTNIYKIINNLNPGTNLNQFIQCL